MRILPTDSSELASHPYSEIMPGVYACPESGRLVIVNDDDAALLILTETARQ